MLAALNPQTLAEAFHLFRGCGRRREKKRFFNPQIDMKSDFLRTCRGGVSRRHRRIYFHATVVIKNNYAPPLNGFKLKWKLLIR